MQKPRPDVVELSEHYERAEQGTTFHEALGRRVSGKANAERIITSAGMQMLM